MSSNTGSYHIFKVQGGRWNKKVDEPECEKVGKIFGAAPADALTQYIEQDCLPSHFLITLVDSTEKCDFVVVRDSKADWGDREHYYFQVREIFDGHTFAFEDRRAPVFPIQHTDL